MVTMETAPATAVNYSIRMPRELKDESETLFRALGLNLSTAIQVFLKQAVMQGGMPFDVRMPRYSRETLEAMRESNALAHDPNVRTYSVDEAFAELDK